MHPGLGSATLLQLAFPWEGNPNFPWEKSHWNNTAVKKSFLKSKLACFSVELFFTATSNIYSEVVSAHKVTEIPVTPTDDVTENSRSAN